METEDKCAMEQTPSQMSVCEGVTDMSVCDTLTDRHPLPNFYAKQEKRRRRKISGSLRGGKGRHLSFALVAPGQETPPAFEGETTMKRALHLHKNTCLY